MREKYFYNRQLKCDKCAKLISYFHLYNPEESSVNGLCLECSEKYGRLEDLEKSDLVL
jgi:hypothetical protein